MYLHRLSATHIAAGKTLQPMMPWEMHPTQGALILINRSSIPFRHSKMEPRKEAAGRAQAFTGILFGADLEAQDHCKILKMLYLACWDCDF